MSIGRTSPRERRIQELGIREPDLAAIYFLHASFSDTVKIGTTKKLGVRLRNLQTGSPGRLVTLAAIHVGQEHALMIEKLIHTRYEAQRVRGEWFRATPELLRFATDKEYRENLDWWQSALAQARAGAEPSPFLCDLLLAAFEKWRPLAVRAGITRNGRGKTLWLLMEDGEIDEIRLQPKVQGILMAELARLAKTRSDDDEFLRFVYSLSAQLQEHGQFVILRPGFSPVPASPESDKIVGSGQNRHWKNKQSVLYWLGQLAKAAPSKSSDPDPQHQAEIREQLNAVVTTNAEPELPAFSVGLVGSGQYVGSAERLSGLF